MRRIVLFMARHRLTWLLWCSLGTPFVALAFALTVIVESLRNLRAMWGWTWKYDAAEWANGFTERHRKSLRSLRARPEAGGEVMRA